MTKLLWLVLLFLDIGAASAQPSRAATSGRRTYVELGRERWIYPGQRESTAPWRTLQDAIVSLDSVQGEFGRGTFAFFSKSTAPDTRMLTVIRRSPTGALQSVEVSVDSSARRGRAASSAGSDPSTQDGFVFGRTADAINLAPMFFGAPAPGGRSTPIDLSARSAKNALTLRGVFTSRRLGDTLVSGRVLQIIRDSGNVELSLLNTYYVRTLYGEQRRERQLRGRLNVRRLYDSERGVTMFADEALSLSGTETRHDADGRVRSTPVRFVRTRTIVLLDSAGARKWSIDRIRQFDDGVGMITRPKTDKERINLRDRRVVDSLVRAHALAKSQAVRDSIENLRGFLDVRGVRERFARFYASAGDTARALASLGRLESEIQLTAWMYRLLRPSLDDPRVALRFGLETNELYEAFEYAFNNYPISLMPNVDSAWCSPEACALVSTEWERAREPRLRTVGLMARFSLDPKKWGDTLVSLAASGTRMLAGLSMSARGVRAPGEGELPIEMPSATAHWRDWWTWLRRGTDETLARRDSIRAVRYGSLGPGLNEPPLRIHDIEDETMLMRLVERRRGISLVDALSQRRVGETNDTARYVYGVLLHGLRAPSRASEELVHDLRSPSALDQLIASREVLRLPFALADSATARTIESTLLGHFIDGAAWWPPLNTVRSPNNQPLGQVRRADSAHVTARSLTRESIAQLARAGIQLHDSNWSLPAELSGRVLSIGAVYRAGAFVRITISDTHLVRLPDGRGGGDASGTTLFLVLMDGIWRVIDERWWVT